MMLPISFGMVKARLRLCSMHQKRCNRKDGTSVYYIHSEIISAHQIRLQP